MREMKFQAYWKEKGIMLGVSSIDFSTYVSDGKSSGLSRFYTLDDYEDESNYIPKGTNFNLYLDEVEMRQYTGLKDRNGKEIYVGDIVRVLIQGGYSQHFIDQEVVTSVMYIPSKAHYKPFDQCRIWMEDGKLPKVEVIGNIYENPELL
ncbi:YopX family protein [Brevibacillus laterosporus]|uniref:YopX protein domain-containing protein n=1 Tax=Brevibacillus laterosporus TaxID=1465 RepID=A0AAP8QGS9_BRELA|nr:YopX family protein [Brevibacillus laterosporus]PPB12937.1 hypothetical protein C4A77_00695 [Brevibacillus laterosporus]